MNAASSARVSIVSTARTPYLWIAYHSPYAPYGEPERETSCSPVLPLVLAQVEEPASARYNVGQQPERNDVNLKTTEEAKASGAPLCGKKTRRYGEQSKSDPGRPPYTS